MGSAEGPRVSTRQVASRESAFAKPPRHRDGLDAVLAAALEAVLAAALEAVLVLAAALEAVLAAALAACTVTFSVPWEQRRRRNNTVA
jgi:hypothetical protein